MSSYYFTNTDAGPPGVGVDHGSNCMDGKNWVCEHRWGPITNMVRWHNTAGTNAVMNWQVGNNNQIAFSRGNVAFIALNRDSNSWKASGLKTGLPAGNYCNVITKDTNSKAAHLQLRGSCKETVTINSLGVVDYMEVPSLSVVALHINDKA